MFLLKKHSFELISLLGLTVVYFVTRLVNILHLPIFTDEAIYTRWSQIASNDANWRFISLTDGKQPSFVWINMVLMKIVDDPLLSGRLVSVGAGAVTMVGMFLLASYLFRNKYIGLIAALLYVLFPMALVYDRMALYDSMVAMFSVWALYFHILLVRTLRLDVAMILGIILGAGAMTKTSGFLSFYMSPLLLLLFDIKKKDRIRRVVKWALLIGVAAFFLYGMYSILRLSPFFHIIENKDSTFVYPFDEWIQHPFRFLVGNLRGLFDWAIGYLTIPIFILAIGAFFVRIKNDYREKALLFLWFFLPFFALALFGKVLYPRYILFMTLPLLILASYTLYSVMGRLSKIRFKIIFLLIFLLAYIQTDYYILTDFAHAPIPKSDLRQFINGWPAGGGVREVISFLEKESQSQKIYVASEGTFGSLPTWSVEIYLDQNKNIEKRGIYPLPNEIPEDLVQKAGEMPVYFILNESEEPPVNWPLVEIGRFQKGISDRYMKLYQVIPENRS